jgi:geranylgeranylglycerol-phosphate geranylgeranyltransferase
MTSTIRGRAGTKLVAHLETWRLYTACYPGLLALSAAVLWRHEMPPPQRCLVIFAVPMVGWIAALYGCDYLDADVDAVQKGHRPLPSRRISDKEAIVAMLGCVYLGLLGSAWLGLATVLLSGAAMATSVVYGFAKRRPMLGPLARGLAAPLTVLFGVQAAGGPVHLPGGWLVLVVFFLHDVTTNLVGEIRDVEGDRAAGCRTVAVRYGAHRARRAAFVLFLAWQLLAVTLPVLLHLRPILYATGYLPALALGVAAMVALGRRPGQRRAALFAHKCFVLERLLLAGALLAAVNLPAALATVVPVLMVSHLSQVLLRDRHEFAPGPLVLQEST